VILWTAKSFCYMERSESPCTDIWTLIFVRMLQVVCRSETVGAVFKKRNFITSQEVVLIFKHT